MKNRIGIVGGGQLARMLAYDAKKMGFVVTVLDPVPNAPGGQVADEQIVAELDSHKALRELSQKSDYMTIEWELADAELLDHFSAKGIPVNPSAGTLAIIKDKLVQHQFLKKNMLPVADFSEVRSREDVVRAGRKFGYPLLLKARHGAYDGRGNALVDSEENIDAAMGKLKGRKLYVEKFVPFEKELSVMVARGMDGEIATYPVVENIHKNNILQVTIAPARISKAARQRARRAAIMTMEHLKGAGVFGIEMFLTKGNEVLINEIAPRVHNSGHYTIEACVTSQFEQHIRAVTGLPLGSVEMLTPAVMVNILGRRNGAAEVKGLEEALGIPGVTVHIYGKAETRPERKMGHITAIGRTTDEALKKAVLARKYISI